MATIAFDTLKFSKRLKDAGVPEKQAEAEAEALAEVLEVNLKELSTRRDIDELRIEFRHELELMRLELRDLERRMTIKLGGLMVVAVGVVAALDKFF